LLLISFAVFVRTDACNRQGWPRKLCDHIPITKQTNTYGGIDMNLVQRAQNIILKPQDEWQVIDTEPTSIAEIYTGYIIPLAAIGPICMIIGYSLIGANYGFVNIKLPIANAIILGVVSYALSLGAVYVIALIIDALAPNFDGQKNINQAFKVAAYSSTPGWIGGIFNILPALAIIGALLGLYGLYLYFLGLPVLMKSPKEKAVGYVVVVIVAAIVVFVIIGVIVGAIYRGFYTI